MLFNVLNVVLPHRKQEDCTPTRAVSLGSRKSGALPASELAVGDYTELVSLLAIKAYS